MNFTVERARSAVSSSRISGGYLLAIGGSSARWLYRYISAYISSDKAERKDIDVGARKEIGGKVTGREKDAAALLLLSLGAHRGWRDRKGGRYIERKTAEKKRGSERRRRMRARWATSCRATIASPIDP